MAEKGMEARRSSPSRPIPAMAEPPPPVPTAVTSSPAVAAFTTRWAEFSKAFAIYPLTNVRVQKARAHMLDSLSLAFQASQADPRIGLRILFGREQVRAGGQVIPLARPSLVAWLEERVRRAALAGVAFLPEVTGEAIAAFTARLLAHYQRRALDLPFRDLWPDPYEGLLLIDRRFEGRFDDAGGEGTDTPGTESDGPGTDNACTRVARLLSEDARVLAQFERLRAQVCSRGAGDDAGPHRPVDILSRIVQLLPRDALQHFDQAVQVTVRIMEGLAERLARTQQVGSLVGFTDDSTLNQLTYATSRGILGRRAPSTAELARHLAMERGGRRSGGNGQRRSGRSSDSAVEDSLDLLLCDMERLPEPFRGEMEPHNAESPDEQLGVYLHVLLHLDTRSRTPAMVKHLADLLERTGDRRLHTLKQYLETTSERGHPGYRRMIDLMCERGLQRMLRTSGFLEARKILEGFPRYFGLYLESLDVTLDDDLSELEDLCSKLGPDRVREAQGDLVDREGITEAHRAAGLLARPSPSMLPFLRILIAQGGHDQRVAATRMLRRLRIHAPEACLLYLCDDPAGLSLPYLLTISDPRQGRNDLEALHPTISHHLCQFLEETGCTEVAEERRIQAIHHLGTFGGPEGEHALRGLLRARWFGLFPVESKAVREAAASALESLQRRPYDRV